MTGTAAARAGIPVVLLHALALHSGMWREQERALSALGHPVLNLDQRGFGAAPLGDVPPSLDVVADDVARALDRHGAERAVLAGCSMGGYTAMAFLRRYPERVAGLALVSARATADGPQEAAQRRRFAEAVQDPAGLAAAIAQATPLFLGATTRARHPGLLDRVRADARAAGPAALAWAQRAIADRPDSTGVLRAARVPAVVLAGAEDELVGAEEAGHAAGCLPYGRLVTVPGAGHLPPLEAPSSVTEALRSLLDEVAAHPGCRPLGAAPLDPLLFPGPAPSRN